MSTLKLSIVTALVATAITAGCLYLVNQRRAAEARSLRMENSRLLMRVLERQSRAPLSESVGALPPAAPDAAGPAAPEPAPVPGDTLVVPVYRDEGVATARAALQTFAWACDRGDAKAVARLFVFDDAARAKAVGLLARMPADVRARWSSVDDMAAELLTLNVMSVPFPGADVLERARLEEIGAGRVRLHLNGAPRHGTELQQTPDGWRYAITERMVDDYIRHSEARQGTP